MGRRSRSAKGAFTLPSGDGIPAAAGSGFCPLAASFRWGAPATERSREPPGSLVSSFLSYSLPDDGRMATGRNSPSGLSQEAEQSRASSDTRRPCIIFLAAGKDRQHGTAHWRGRPLGQFGDKARFDSAPFQEDGSLAGPRQREREKDRFDPCPSSPYSRFTRPPGADPGPNGKARCGAWLGAQAFPERQDSVNRRLILSLENGTPERRGRPGGIRGFTEQ